MTLSPGVYCGGLNIQTGTTDAQPGVYVIRNGALNVASGATLKGNGVTIVLTGQRQHLL